jgi:hypothetical protein
MRKVPNLTEQMSKGLSGVLFGSLLIALICLQPIVRRRLVAGKSRPM